MKLFPCGVVGENSVEQKREGGSGDGRECRRGIYGRSMNNGVGDFDTTSFDSGGGDLGPRVEEMPEGRAVNDAAVCGCSR